ncbi:Zn(II)2Cys6 transcription factor [Apiospora arundinis]|uniref:Zn(II)2Cys6 transcription factor n=1 Tax=Apiospora arundinis TaxID=335852 RepID=A0ABR2HTR7_9PEZI
MPGVPHGRACDECRRQKKKCDCSTPTCSRCLRLGLECIGSGERRYLFKDQKCRRRKSGRRGMEKDMGHHATPPFPPSSLSSSPDRVCIAPPMPPDETQSLVASLVSTIAPSTDIRFNLARVYGNFLDFIPQRLGANAALDTATSALICAHKNICCGLSATQESLTRYSKAVSTLRVSLEDTEIAHSIDMIGAAIILIMCQNLNGLSQKDWSSHCEGAVCILCARLGNGRPLSDFEVAMRSHLRGLMWFQGLWRRDLRINPARFNNLVSGLYDDGQGGDLITKQFQIPRLLTRAREARRSSWTGPESSTILAELYTIYERFRGYAHELGAAFTTSTAPNSAVLIPTAPYGFCLMVACICNCMLRGLLLGIRRQQPVSDDGGLYYGQLCFEAQELVDATLGLARDAAKCKPIGSSHMMPNCLTAWICTSDIERRVQLESVYRGFRQDFSLDRADEDVFTTLKTLESDLCLVSES